MTPGIPWESWHGAWCEMMGKPNQTKPHQTKPHSHFCLLLRGVGHVDNGSFCVCVHCREQERQSWSRDGRGVTAALGMLQRGIQLGWGEGDACPTAHLGTALFSPSTRSGLDPRLDPSRMQGWISVTHQWIPSYTQLIFASRDNSFSQFFRDQEHSPGWWMDDPHHPTTGQVAPPPPAGFVSKTHFRPVLLVWLSN